jgi:hypothetical protein
MLPWRDAQAAFAAAVLSPDRPAPGGLSGPTGPADAKRFDVYRNNVASALIGSLAASYPVLAALLGGPAFRDLARAYVGLHRPASPILAEYGAELADFVAGFAPVRHLEFLPDIARLEWARLKAYHSADAAPATLAELQSRPPEDLADLHLDLHPSAKVVRSAWPIVTIWQAHGHDDTADRLAALDYIAEDALVCRPALEVGVRRLPPGAAAFMTALGRGQPLGEAARAGQSDDGDFDLAAAIGGLFEAGAVAGIVDAKASGEAQ